MFNIKIQVRFEKYDSEKTLCKHSEQIYMHKYICAIYKHFIVGHSGQMSFQYNIYTVHHMNIHRNMGFFGLLLL